MKVVIPMSGFGNRFVQAGYTDPKPLIKVDGKPIIEHVVNLFPGEDDFIFICNETHLKETNMRETLLSIKPNAKIMSIPPHKLGPVYAVAYAFEEIADNEEVIVNYCDFGTYWNYEDFLHCTRGRKSDGAIPSYRGFHPHMLGSDNYAFIRDDNKKVLDIQEKKPFTDDKMSEYASNGTYYFRTGEILKKYFNYLLDNGPDLKGEYYVSCVYIQMIKDGLNISVYEIDHMLQWGTPKDLEDYVGWSNTFRRMVDKRDDSVYADINLIPMAGRGSRFSKHTDTPKPFIEVSGKDMVVQSSQSLPKSKETVFVALKEHYIYNLERLGGRVVLLDDVTEGQAVTCAKGLDAEDYDKSVLIGTCDNGLLFDSDKWKELLDSDVDVAVWTFMANTATKNNPNMYTYVDTDEDDNALRISMKKPISDTPEKDHAIVGVFYFKKLKYFLSGYKELLWNENRFNGEYYADSVIQEIIDKGKRNVKIFKVNDYICWGTPNDLKTFEYWQEYFHKCPYHEYSLDKDPMMDKEKIDGYEFYYYMRKDNE